VVSVLIIEDDASLSDLLYAMLTDEGYRATVLRSLDPEGIRVAVGRLEPDCVLLDGSGYADYGDSWETAAWLQQRGRPVPTIMLTGFQAAADEAQAGLTERSRAAGFAAVHSKPFDLDELLTAVERACGSSVAGDGSEAAVLP
jgi:CheY-like chemotaxis protein